MRRDIAHILSGQYRGMQLLVWLFDVHSPIIVCECAFILARHTEECVALRSDPWRALLHSGVCYLTYTVCAVTVMVVYLVLFDMRRWWIDNVLLLGWSKDSVSM
jgi:hypothetical protein